METENVNRVIALARASVRETHRDLMQPYLQAFAHNLPPALVQKADTHALLAFLMERFAFLEEDAGNEVKVRISKATDDLPWGDRNPTVIETRLPDAAFIVKTLQTFLRAQGIQILLTVHPVFGVTVQQGQIVSIDPTRRHGTRFSQVYLRVSDIPEERWPGLTADLERRMRTLLRVNRDFAATIARLDAIRGAYAGQAAATPSEALSEVGELLAWLRDNNFIFMGYAFVPAASNGEVAFENPLGVLDPTVDPALQAVVRQLAVRRITRPEPYAFYRTDHRSTVRSLAQLRYVGVHERGTDGEVQGEHVFVGLLSANALMEPNRRIPIVNKRIGHVLSSQSYPPGSYTYQKLSAILNSIPNEDLFYSTNDEIAHTATFVRHAEATDQGGVYVWRRPGATRVSIVCVIPLANYTEALDAAVERTICDFLGAPSLREYRRDSDDDYGVRRFFYVSAYRSGVDEAALKDLENRLRELLVSWEERLQKLVYATYRQRDEAAGSSKYLAVTTASGPEIWSRYGAAFPAAYRATQSPATALGDIGLVEKVHTTGEVQVSMSLHERGTELRILSQTPLMLNDVVPVLQLMCLSSRSLLSEVLTPAGRPPAHVTSFDVKGADGSAIGTDADRQRLAEILHRVLTGSLRPYPLLGLGQLAGLDWKQVRLLIAYRLYFRQVFPNYTMASIDESMLHNPTCARLLVRYFETKFDPRTSEAPPQRAPALAALAEEFDDALEAVTVIQEDLFLRLLFELMKGTIRTNHFKPGRTDVLSLKISSRTIEHMPRPCPLYEIWVHGPYVDGIHLRDGKVARGGLRHSDRPDDFRTEVQGLQRTQTLKNSVIVPVGSKGGFVTRRTFADRAQMAAEVTRQYESYISALLDLTDNYQGDSVTAPAGVVRYDEDDPYLVVAADKGTAHLSDTANAISLRYGHWLDDAFASGGSQGYDHKVMGITSRGAWTNVERHFREMGVDLRNQSVKVAGVGDMSGDVFGNAMLLNHLMRLVAAFNHKHIFLDPDPDVPKAFAERQRMFALPGSQWSDYDKRVISQGGGIYERAAKSITVSPEAQALLGLPSPNTTGPEIVKRILALDVDLMWFGGIGTYVKASTETHGDVGDKVNDPVRIDSSELKAKVIGEGANLAITQKGRVEFLLKGGRCNTDAIDNSAGVNCSDQEVNIKILMSQLLGKGVIKSREDRNALLKELTPDVAAHCVRNNYLQSALITMEAIRSTREVESFVELIGLMETRAGLDRRAEAVPNDEAFREWFAAGIPTPRNLVAILVAYTKNLLFGEILGSRIPDMAFFDPTLSGYFPRKLRENYGQTFREHRLKREIVATIVSNALVNQAGMTFVFDLAKEGSVSFEDLVVRYFVCDDLLGGTEFRKAVHGLDWKVAAADQYAALLSLEDTLRTLVRWWIWNDGTFKLAPEDVSAARTTFGEASDAIEAAQAPDAAAAMKARATELAGRGFDAALAEKVARLPVLGDAFLVSSVAQATGQSATAIASALAQLTPGLQLDRVDTMLRGLRPSNSWERRFQSILEREVGVLRRSFVLRALRDGGTPAAFLASQRDRIGKIANALQRVNAAGYTGPVPLFILLDDYRALLA